MESMETLKYMGRINSKYWMDMNKKDNKTKTVITLLILIAVAAILGVLFGKVLLDNII
ncbi:MAG: cytochrome c biogenesis protein ResB [Bacillota bacterium]|nr:cytochrome c biogenesis protein ResB [Bacillota bacterium]